MGSRQWGDFHVLRVAARSVDALGETKVTSCESSSSARFSVGRQRVIIAAIIGFCVHRGSPTFDDSRRRCLRNCLRVVYDDPIDGSRRHHVSRLLGPLNRTSQARNRAQDHVMGNLPEPRGVDEKRAERNSGRVGELMPVAVGPAMLCRGTVSGSSRANTPINDAVTTRSGVFNKHHHHVPSHQRRHC